MLFNTPEYFLFLLIVLILYYGLTRPWQNRMLLVASYFFYGVWDYRFLGLILLSTVVDFFAGRAIFRSRSPARRRLFLLTSLGVNLGVLGFFKYFNFFVDSAATLLGLFNFQPHLPVLYVILPVGISFYTFQTMAYSIDIYRGQMEPVENFRDFALYVCYFPQLVAGPIERPRNLLPALQARRRVTADQFTSGLVLILIGLFRKVVIADGIGGEVDRIFGSYGRASTPELILGIYLFALQIYCDFAGYTGIARGTSRLLGIELMENFNQPYFASNVAEFWRRWHISLSTWLRDYLYIPLGGNRRGTLNTYRNLMLTMLLGGLWHGAAWVFVIWGGLHGLYLVAYRIFSRWRRSPTATAGARWTWSRAAGMILTFHLVLLAWVFFRAPGLRAALEYLQLLFSFREMGDWVAVLPALLLPWLLVLAIDIPQYALGDQVFLRRVPRLARHALVALMLLLVLLGAGTRAPFIYFQF